MASRLQEKYMKEVAPALMEKFGYKNVMEIPKLDKRRNANRSESYIKS